MEDLLIFGKPEVGNPIAAQAISTEPMIRRFGCGSLIPSPTSFTNGKMMRAATVWLMNVATTAISAAKTHIIPYRLRPSTFCVMLLAMVCNRPELLTALPSAKPPAARIIIVQRKLLKSSFVKMPVPKNSTIGIIAMTPISPKKPSSWWLKHHRTMVARVTIVMNHWIPVNLSFIGRIGMMVVFRPGRKVTRRRSQMSRIVMIHTGRAMKNQIPHPGCGCMFCRAMRF